MKTPVLSVLLVGFLSGLLSACVSFAETPEEHFRKALKEIEAACAKRKLDQHEVCGGVAKLKPADPLATEEGRFAHSIKIPNPLPEDSGYKPGMTPEQYFEHLCKTEAGEFIYKTVEHVEGVFMMRPREPVNDYTLQHLYALEDPFGDIDFAASKPEDYFVQPPFGRYEFLEVPVKARSSGKSVYLRYYRGDPHNSKRPFDFMQDNHSERVPYIVESKQVSELRSRYGFSWRGIKRPNDRELGIIGGELIVLDIQTNEVLAVRRGYIRSGDVRNNLTGVWWLGGHVCPQHGHNTVYISEFISKVLKGEEGGRNASK